MPGSYHGDWVSDLFFQLTVYLSGTPGNVLYDMEEVDRISIVFDVHGFPLVDGEMDYCRPGDTDYACHVILTETPPGIRLLMFTLLHGLPDPPNKY